MTWSRSPARVRRRSRRSRRTSGSPSPVWPAGCRVADREDGRPASRGRPTPAEIGRAGAAQAQQAARAGERDPAPGDGVLRPRHAPKMMFPLVRDLAADKIPVAVTCRVLGFSKQAFYTRWNQPGHPAGLGRRAPDQRRPRHPSRRPGVRLPVHRRRARPRHPRRAQPGQPALQRAPGLVGARAQARPEPQARPAGP